mmetsp:Transcript_27690/g.50143  ORF Transcript_27690/g.50143 Transcript_27690/m.50143 type:complete len:209 (+) Transcript_27690:117-743(+)
MDTITVQDGYFVSDDRTFVRGQRSMNSRAKPCILLLERRKRCFLPRFRIAAPTIRTPSKTCSRQPRWRPLPSLHSMKESFVRIRRSMHLKTKPCFLFVEQRKRCLIPCILRCLQKSKTLQDLLSPRWRHGHESLHSCSKRTLQDAGGAINIRGGNLIFFCGMKYTLLLLASVYCVLYDEVASRQNLSRGNEISSYRRVSPFDEKSLVC